MCAVEEGKKRGEGRAVLAAAVLTPQMKYT